MSSRDNGSSTREEKCRSRDKFGVLARIRGMVFINENARAPFLSLLEYLLSNTFLDSAPALSSIPHAGE
jgi:hypothetical protein